MLRGALRSARVMLFAYPARVDPELDLIRISVDEFRKRLIEARRECSDRPIVFIGHDFGIIIIERLIIALRDAEAAGPLFLILQSTAGIMFLSTLPETDISSDKSCDYFEDGKDRDPRLGPRKERLPVANSGDSYITHHLEQFRHAIEQTTRTEFPPSLERLRTSG